MADGQMGQPLLFASSHLRLLDVVDFDVTRG